MNLFRLRLQSGPHNGVSVNVFSFLRWRAVFQKREVRVPSARMAIIVRAVLRDRVQRSTQCESVHQIGVGDEGPAIAHQVGIARAQGSIPRVTGMAATDQQRRRPQLSDVQVLRCPLNGLHDVRELGLREVNIRKVQLV